MPQTIFVLILFVGYLGYRNMRLKSEISMYKEQVDSVKTRLGNMLKAHEEAVIAQVILDSKVLNMSRDHQDKFLKELLDGVNLNPTADSAE